jgi:hypothetical protein
MSQLPTAPLRRLIDAKAEHHGLPFFHSVRYNSHFTPGEWLEGLILTESSGNPRARRYEPHQDRATRTDVATDADRPDVDDGQIEDDASYGLCQVMGYNIVRLTGGGRGERATRDFAFAFDPDVNIWLGIQVLRGEMAVVSGDVERALARYNGGPTGAVVAPKFGNDMRLRAYVDRVVANARKVQADRG